MLAVVDPGVRIGFGDSGGAKDFKSQVIGSRNEDFWREFGTILRLGGRFRTNDAFDAPYTFSAWPENLDSFECLAITGTRVRVRASPRLDARIVTQLDSRSCAPIPEKRKHRDGEAFNWRTGDWDLSRHRYIRGPIDRRALFQFHDGRWWLMAYVAGD